jgi:hypothetical protein
MWLKWTCGSFRCRSNSGRIDHDIVFRRFFWCLFFVIMKSFSTDAAKDRFSVEERLGNSRIQSVIVESQQLHGRRRRKEESCPQTLERTVVLGTARCSLIIVTRLRKVANTHFLDHLLFNMMRGYWFLICDWGIGYR